MDNENISFGAVPSLDDPRTLTTASFAAAATPALVEGKVALDYDHVNELCDQRKLGVRMAAEHHFRDGVRLDEYWGYLIGKTLYDDGIFGHFEGSSALTMLKAANRQGVPERDFCKSFPLATDGTYEEFIGSFRQRYGGQIPAAVLANAARHRIPGYVRVAGDPLAPLSPDPAAVSAEVARGRVVVGRFAVGRNLYRDKADKPTRKAADLLPLRAPDPAESGHIMAISQFWERGAQLGGPNSWSRTWCPDNDRQEAGYYWFAAETQRPYFTEAWAILDASDRYVFGKDLTLGSTGPDVVALQRHLVKVGLMVLPPDASYGYFGLVTRAAVARYQAQNGIAPVAGYFGPKTRTHLNANQ